MVCIDDGGVGGTVVQLANLLVGQLVQLFELRCHGHAGTIALRPDSSTCVPLETALAQS